VDAAYGGDEAHHEVPFEDWQVTIVVQMAAAAVEETVVQAQAQVSQVDGEEDVRRVEHSTSSLPFLSQQVIPV
jgi:hypothetical protein